MSSWCRSKRAFSQFLPLDCVTLHALIVLTCPLLRPFSVRELLNYLSQTLKCLGRLNSNGFSSEHRRSVMSSTMAIEAPTCEPHIFNNIQTDARLFGGMPIAIFGIITNIINIVVFLDQEMRCSLVNHFLLVGYLANSMRRSLAVLRWSAAIRFASERTFRRIFSADMNIPWIAV